MAPRRMIDLLKHAEAFHHKLSVFYAFQSRETHNDALRTLLQYMSRHEDILEHAIQSYEDGASKSVLDSWFKVSPDFSRFPHLEDLELGGEMTADEVVDLALALDNVLIAMYEELQREAVSADLREALDSLLDMERREEIRLMRAAITA